MLNKKRRLLYSIKLLPVALYFNMGITELSKAETYTAYNLTQDYVGSKAGSKETFDMDVRFDASFGVLLHANVKNTTLKALCIPANFYSRESLIPLEHILQLTYNTDEVVPLLFNPPRLDWPPRNYFILPPSAENSSVINLSNIYDFSNAAGKTITIKFAFPAFDCDVFESGFPVTSRMYEARALIGQEEVKGFIIVEPSDIVLFSSSISLPFPQ